MASTGTAKTLTGDALSQLAEKAAANKVGGLAYGGDISPRDAFSYLSQFAGVVVDVRTIPEFQFVGVPNLAQTPSKLLTLSWKNYPAFTHNPQFAEQLSADDAVGKDTPLFFLCRSGGRSLDAAVAMTALGYQHCYNIAGGFEGDADAQGHRGVVQGWKAANLPWAQG